VTEVWIWEEKKEKILMREKNEASTVVEEPVEEQVCRIRVLRK
jgi:hypothetical protein